MRVGERCQYCGKVLVAHAARVRVRLHRPKVLGGGTDRASTFHPACFARFERNGGRLPESGVVWEILELERVGFGPAPGILPPPIWCAGEDAASHLPRVEPLGSAGEDAHAGADHGTRAHAHKGETP